MREPYGDDDFDGTGHFAESHGEPAGDMGNRWSADPIEEARTTWACYRDRRPDAYGPRTGA